jgi:hypothetical protein
MDLMWNVMCFIYQGGINCRFDVECYTFYFVGWSRLWIWCGMLCVLFLKVESTVDLMGNVVVRVELTGFNVECYTFYFLGWSRLWIWCGMLYVLFFRVESTVDLV